MTGTTRRELLVFAVQLGGGGALALAVAPFGCGPGGVTTIDLSQVLTNPDDIVEIGRAYTAEFPDEATREALDAALADPDIEPDDPRALRASLHARVRADFAAHRWFAYRGWLFSRTEGRLCALAFVGA